MHMMPTKKERDFWIRRGATGDESQRILQRFGDACFAARRTL